MGDVVIRFAGRRRRILDHLLTVQAHTNLPHWEHDPIRRDAVAFRLVQAAKLARDRDRPDDIGERDWAWLRDVARFGGVNEPPPEEFRRVVEIELPGVLGRITATLDA